jgi:hypothetical protein
MKTITELDRDSRSKMLQEDRMDYDTAMSYSLEERREAHKELSEYLAEVRSRDNCPDIKDENPEAKIYVHWILLRSMLDCDLDE